MGGRQESTAPRTCQRFVRRELDSRFDDVLDDVSISCAEDRMVVVGDLGLESITASERDLHAREKGRWVCLLA